MKNPTKQRVLWPRWTLAALVAACLCGSAHADLSISNSTTITSWNQVNGQTPVYVSLPSANLTGFTAQGMPSAGAGATYTAASETFTITNGAGSLANGATNYLLTGMAMIGSSQPANSSIHLYDITTTLSASSGNPLQVSSATYNFVTNGDLLGSGNGLPLTNTFSGTSQVLYNLSSGPFTYDQVVLAAGHTYAFEIWAPASAGLNWDRNSTADPGGQGMGSHNASYSVARLTMASLGEAGGAPRTFALALYGTPTSAAATVNNNTNIVPQRYYTVDDFSTNGVGAENPTNDDWFSTETNYVDGGISTIWKEWFGNGVTGVTFDPNVNVSGNTNQNGAMAIALTWTSAGGTYQQFVLWRGNANPTDVPVPGGTVGIGYPQYTALECDVMFDPISAGTTNTNGVIGVVRLGVRGNNANDQAWINGSYTTISDTNWHHIVAPLNNSNPDYGNIGGVIIGEDVNASVGGGGLNGNQILYVDNIRFTGPLAAPPIPPPTLGTPQQAKPGLRIFAGSAVNTYDREMLYTVDQNQSWVDPGAHFPVSYSFSLQDYNPNIQQAMVELIGGGTTPTSYGEYADYSGPTTLWLELNPVAGGQVMASVQWKTNLSGANPNMTATRFTNSTAVGTWSLVFTSTNTGYVSAPGQVISGSTSFTITNDTVTTDFADPVFAGFGLQPNTTAGEGQYLDWGMISVTGVLDGNEFEDFTQEGSDVGAATPNVTPSGFFNNSMSALTNSLIIQTTNDAWWVNWTQPANGFTLASSTNLVHPRWINPGYYSGYTDTNAPRVMPLTRPFAGNFWVLLPKDDLPTANGISNSVPPAAGPFAPNAFFVVTTNTVSP